MLVGEALDAELDVVEKNSEKLQAKQSGGGGN
jgi:hypothetical protein